MMVERRINFLEKEEPAISEKVSRIRDVLGRDLATLALIRTKDEAVESFNFENPLLENWANGEVEPDEESRNKIVPLYEDIKYFLQYDHPSTISAWFGGMNGDLDDRSPAVVMAEDRGAVSNALRAYVASGG